MPLYRRKYEPIEKLAGTKISSSPNQWNVEVMKTLVNEHPYISAEEAEVRMDRKDAEKKEATGRIIIRDELAIPFSIGQDEAQDQTEIDPLDILFIPDPSGDGGEFRHLNESSYKQAIQGEAVGEVYPPEGEEGHLPAENEYVGDMTGSVSPLEYSGSHGGMMSTAGCGVLSHIIRDGDQLSRLNSLLRDYRGVNISAERLGLRDSLANMEAGGFETRKSPDFVQISRTDDGGLVLEYQGGHRTPVSAKNLKEALPTKYKSILQEVMNRGWAILRDFPVIKTPEVPAINTLPGPVEEGGWYEVVSKGGDSKQALICPMMLDFDGQSIKEQMAICHDGKHDRGKVFCGTPIKRPQKTPSGEIKTGKTGVFLKESFGSHQTTPRIKIEKLLTEPDQPPIIIGARMDTLESIGLVLVDALTRPEKMRDTSIEAALPDNSYYFPASYRFVEISGDADLLDEAERDSVGEHDDRPVARLRKNAGWYSIHGDIQNGDPVSDNMLSENEMRLKLASLSADDHVIEQACDMGDQDELTLRGLRPCNFRMREMEKFSADRATLQHIRRAGKEALEGYNAWMKTAEAQQQEDPQTLDAILSLQFVNDDTLRDIVQSEPLFTQVEDKLSRMLLAARRGEKSIHEEGVQRALKGIGDAQKSIKTLRIELQDRDQ